jgi:hypothetical protein
MIASEEREKVSPAQDKTRRWFSHQKSRKCTFPLDKYLSSHNNESHLRGELNGEARRRREERQKSKSSVIDERAKTKLMNGNGKISHSKSLYARINGNFSP